MQISHFLDLSSLPVNAKRYIVSIDLGVENFAYATLDVRNRAIIDWRLLALPHEKEVKNIQSNLYLTRRYTDTDMKLVHAKWDTLDFGIPRSHMWSEDSVMFVVEEQVKQNARMLKLSNWITEYASVRKFTITMVESSLRYAYMMSRLSSERRGTHTRAEVKYLACTLVSKQVIGKLDVNLQTVYLTAHKKDDLADCILQLLASINKRPGWLQNPGQQERHKTREVIDLTDPKVTISRKPRSKPRPKISINLSTDKSTKQRISSVKTRSRSGPLPRSIVFW